MRSVKRVVAALIMLPFLMVSLLPSAGAVVSGANMPWMPEPGILVRPSAAFSPASLWGMTVYPSEPFKFDFLIERGDANLNPDQKEEEYNKLVKYFLAALAVPDTDQWVNLSPFESDRIIPDQFGMTAMGRDLLAQDYLLKQFASSLTDPQTDLGKKFWEGVYAESERRFGQADVPTDVFNKVWILPDKAVVYERENSVYVLESHLKVMTDSDYLAMNNGSAVQSGDSAEISSQILKEVIIPAIEKEVNEGQSFASLRQVYSGMLLATWYKKRLKDSILGRIYANQGKLRGVDQDPINNKEIYNRYLEAYRKGVYNVISDAPGADSGVGLPRKYFSGGAINTFDQSMTVEPSLAVATPILTGRGISADTARVVVNEPPDLAGPLDADYFATLIENNKVELVAPGKYRLAADALGGTGLSTVVFWLADGGVTISYFMDHNYQLILERHDQTLNIQRIYGVMKAKEERGAILEVNAGGAGNNDDSQKGIVPGGVDMAQSSLDMQILRDARGKPLAVSRQDLSRLAIRGLEPTIVDISPAEALIFE